MGLGHSEFHTKTKKNKFQNILCRTMHIVTPRVAYAVAWWDGENRKKSEREKSKKKSQISDLNKEKIKSSLQV